MQDWSFSLTESHILSVTAPPIPENILGIGSKRLKNRRILVTNF